MAAEQQPQHMGIILLWPVFKAGEVHCDTEGHEPAAPLHGAVLGGDDGQLVSGLFYWHRKGAHGTSISFVVGLDRRPQGSCEGCVKTQTNENTD